MDEDEILSKITRLLERGCTMLASHHDCGAPLFRCQGEIVCPVCSFSQNGEEEELSPVGIERSDLSVSMEEKAAPERERHAAAEGERSSSLKPERAAAFASEGMDREAEAKARLRASLIARLDELSGAIRSERDLDRLKKLLDCAEGLLSVLRFL